MTKDLGRRTVIAGGLSLFGSTVIGAHRANARQTGMIHATDVSWSYVADTVMGGVSQGGSVVENGHIRLSGTVSTENRGGFIQTRTFLTEPPAQDVRELQIRVRGNGERYFIHLRTRATRLPWQYYQAGFDTDGQWRDIALPLSAFERSGRLLPARIDPRSIRSVALVAIGRDHDADVSLAAMGFYADT